VSGWEAAALLKRFLAVLWIAYTDGFAVYWGERRIFRWRGRL